MGAKSHADAEFVGLQADGIRHDAEEADEGESESDAGTSPEGNEAEFGFHVNVLLQELIERLGAK